MKKAIKKGNLVHVEGQTNLRTVTCKHSGEKLSPGEGYKMVSCGSYGFVKKAYKDLYKVGKKTSTYKHGIQWAFSVLANESVIRSLAEVGWATIKFDEVCLLTNTLNKLKGLKEVGTFDVVVEIETFKGNTKTLTLEHVTYDQLRDTVVVETKRLRYIEDNGFDKGTYSLHPDFINP